MMVKAVLKKPLDGKPEGTIVEYNKTDFAMLEKLGAVALAPEGDATDTSGGDGDGNKLPVDPPAAPDGDTKADLMHANKMAPAPANKAEKPAVDKAEKPAVDKAPKAD